jgi:dUTP pyrophosphatase
MTNLQQKGLELIDGILLIDDDLLEKDFDIFLQAFVNESSIEEAFQAKLAECRGNNVTVDDLLAENLQIAEMEIALSEKLSPVKQRLFHEIFVLSMAINTKVMNMNLVSSVRVRVQQLNEVELPQYAHAEGDSGLDIKILYDTIVPARSAIIAPTGLKMAIPLGYEIQIRPRSGNSLKPEYLFLSVANSPGTIDANYREELGVILKNLGDTPIAIQKGTKIAQMVLCPVVHLRWEVVDNIYKFPTERSGGFGSTGN